MIKQVQEMSVPYPEIDPTKKSESKARVFLVEDELLVLEDLKERLTQQNYEVVGTACSGDEAIDKIVSSNPDLVLIDVRIKGELDGIEVAIVIQSYFDAPVPVVFVTGSSESTFPYLKVLPEYIYLNKPYQDTILFDAIQRALTKTRQERAS